MNGISKPLSEFHLNLRYFISRDRQRENKEEEEDERSIFTLNFQRIQMERHFVSHFPLNFRDINRRRAFSTYHIQEMKTIYTFK